MSGVHVIAEAGTNHNGDFDIGRQLIDVAVDARADSVKFQVIYPEGLYVAKFPENGGYRDNEVIEARRKGMLSDDDYRRLAEHARERGLPMTASVFDTRGLDLLESIDAPFIKLASVDLNNIAFVREVAERGRKVILSTGMSTLDEVEQSVEAFLSTGNRDLVLMHCVSVYPCPLEGMNLGFIDVLRTRFGLPLGFSDHSESSLAAAIAVSKGVSFIEKHFTLDRASEGFDHAYAMEPDMLTAYIADVRAAEQACAPPLHKVGPAESTTRERARRALYAAADLEPGHVLGPEDLLVVRPQGPLPASAFDAVVGQRVTRALRQYEAIAPDSIGT